VSVRLGTLLHVIFPHDWQISSATADIPSRLPDPPSRSSACNFAASFLGASSAIAEDLQGAAQVPRRVSAKRHFAPIARPPTIRIIRPGSPSEQRRIAAARSPIT
jgi:hypothetical protein